MHNPVSIVNAAFSKQGHFGNVHIVALLFSNFSFYPFCPPFACLQCKGWAIAMTLSVCLSVCPHKTRNCEETERRTKKVLEIKVVGYRDSYSGVPSVVTSDDL
jgi:hypothetical protein